MGNQEKKQKMEILASDILIRVSEAMQWDCEYGEFSDNGNFVMSMTREEMQLLKEIVLKKRIEIK